MKIHLFDSEYNISESTIVGRRQENQDSCGWIALTKEGTFGSSITNKEPDDRELFLAIVCDGMGGLKNGAAASSFIVTNSLDWIRTTTKEDLDDLCSEYSSIIRNLEKELRIKLPGSGTTISMLIGTKTGWANIHLGDSRTYLKNIDGRYTRSSDDSPVEEMFKAGIITEDEMNENPMKNIISKFIGGDYAECIEIERIENWKTAVLCSDGAYGCMKKNDFQKLIDTCDADNIVARCYESGSTDNITVIKIER